MTHLLAYLVAHGYSPVEIVRVHTGALRAFSASCTLHHHLTAFAQYGSHAVLYCYGS